MSWVYFNTGSLFHISTLMDCFLNYHQITAEKAVKFLTSSVHIGSSMCWQSSFLPATTIQINSKYEILPNIFTLYVSPSGVWPFCKPMDCSPPGSSVHGIYQAWILEWVAISSSGESSRPGDGTYVSYIGRWILYHWTTWEALQSLYPE